MDNDTYALDQLKLQEAYWMERDRSENLALVRSQIAAVEQRIASRVKSPGIKVLTIEEMDAILKKASYA